MKKKILSVLLCLMFLASPIFLAGCGEAKVETFTVKYYNNFYFAPSYYYQNSLKTPVKTLYRVKKGMQLEQYFLRTYLDYDRDNDKHIYYNQVGWYLDTGCTIPWLETDTVQNNLSLYAKWMQVTT